MKHANKVNNVRKNIRYMSRLLRDAEAKQEKDRIKNLAPVVELLRSHESKLTRNYISI